MEQIAHGEIRLAEEDSIRLHKYQKYGGPLSLEFLWVFFAEINLDMGNIPKPPIELRMMINEMEWKCGENMFEDLLRKLKLSGDEEEMVDLIREKIINNIFLKGEDWARGRIEEYLITKNQTRYHTTYNQEIISRKRERSA